MITETRETRIVHFRVGENAGALITTIAQEHLLYTLDPVKALETLTDSLTGCPTALALKILKGDIVLTVDVENQQFIAEERIPEIHDQIFPKLNVKDWYERKLHEILSTGEDLKKSIDQTMFWMKYKKVNKTYDFGQILKFINDKDSMLDDLIESSEDVYQVYTVIKIYKEFITKTLKIQSIMDWMRKTYPEEFEGVPDRKEYDTLQTVMEKFKDMYNMDFSRQDNELNKFITSMKEIDDVIDKGIEPVNIMDNWSAGWLSPKGEYYALNGEIANMLHNQIGDALQEKGIVDKKPDDSDGVEINPDLWLGQHGWVKIHGNNVQFEGCMNYRNGGRDLNMNSTQIKIIYDYICACHKGIIKLGWKMETVSAIRFKDMAESNPEFVNEKYFRY